MLQPFTETVKLFIILRDSFEHCFPKAAAIMNTALSCRLKSFLLEQNFDFAPLYFSVKISWFLDALDITVLIPLFYHKVFVLQSGVWTDTFGMLCTYACVVCCVVSLETSYWGYWRVQCFAQKHNIMKLVTRYVW